MEIFAHGRWDEGMILTIITPLDLNLSNVDIVLYRRHCDICRPTNDFLF